LIADKLRRVALSECDDAFVAVEGGRVVGCISVHVHELFQAAGRLGRITALVVDRRAQGKGVGRALVERADDYFKASGCIRAEVTSGDHRADAHRFYIANGYAAAERRFVKRF
jgi:GNAT superfamily N-acetyltransferase